MAERPHRTIKEKIRCMLYSARLGTEFWVDALLHATWLYNCIYHSAIEMTPYKAFTTVRPDVSSLLTWGCKVTAKQPGLRTSTIDPHLYDGIFLGYLNTMTNIRYYDIHTGTTKTARHGTKDEVQYSDPPEERSPASEHLIKVITGSANEDVGANLDPHNVEVT